MSFYDFYTKFKVFTFGQFLYTCSKETNNIIMYRTQQHSLKYYYIQLGTPELLTG